MAKARVTVGSSPYGTKATIIPMAKMKPSAGFIPAIRTANIKKIMPTPIAIIVMILVTFVSSICNGLNSLLVV